MKHKQTHPLNKALLIVAILLVLINISVLVIVIKPTLTLFSVGPSPENDSGNIISTNPKMAPAEPESVEGVVLATVGKEASAQGQSPESSASTVVNAGKKPAGNAGIMMSSCMANISASTFSANVGGYAIVGCVCTTGNSVSNNITWRSNVTGSWDIIPASNDTAIDCNGSICMNTSAVELEVWQNHTINCKTEGTYNIQCAVPTWTLSLANATLSCTAALLFANGDGTSGNPYQITSWADLNNTRANLTAYYVLMNNLNSSSVGYDGLGNNWTPIGDCGPGSACWSGNYNYTFRGSFNGNNNTISDLTTILTSTDYVGLFGYTTGNISDIGLLNVYLAGYRMSGSLVGAQNGGIISNSYSTGNMYGTTYIGGLIGQQLNGTVSNCSSSTTVNVAGGGAGGLMGYSEGTISGSHATGIVTASGNSVGGLVGWQQRGSISNCYATGNVSGLDSGSVGGLIGGSMGNVSNSYSIVTKVGGGGSNYVGALIGYVYSGLVNNCFSVVDTSSSLNSMDKVGFVTYYNGTINNSYMTIRDMTFGNITFLDWNVTGTGNMMLDFIAIGNNSVFVNSTARPGYNKSANITLMGLPQTFANPKIYRDGIYICNDTTSPSCHNFTSLNAGTVKFNVSSWSNYSIQETSLDCGTLSSPGTYTLGKSLTAAGTCFDVTADNVTIDCAGFKISGSGNAVTAADNTNTLIKNCNISFSGGYAFAADNTDDGNNVNVIFDNSSIYGSIDTNAGGSLGNSGSITVKNSPILSSQNIDAKMNNWAGTPGNITLANITTVYVPGEISAAGDPPGSIIAANITNFTSGNIDSSGYDAAAKISISSDYININGNVLCNNPQYSCDIDIVSTNKNSNSVMSGTNIYAYTTNDGYATNSGHVNIVNFSSVTYDTIDTSAGSCNSEPLKSVNGGDITFKDVDKVYLTSLIKSCAGGYYAGNINTIRVKNFTMSSSSSISSYSPYGGNINITADYIGLNSGVNIDAYATFGSGMGNINLISTNSSTGSSFSGLNINSNVVNGKPGSNVYITNFSTVNFNNFYSNGGNITLKNIPTVQAGTINDYNDYSSSGDILVTNVNNFTSDDINAHGFNNGGNVNITAGYINVGNIYTYSSGMSPRAGGNVYLVSTNRSSNSISTGLQTDSGSYGYPGGNVYVANFSRVGGVTSGNSYIQFGGNVTFENVGNITGNIDTHADYGGSLTVIGAKNFMPTAIYTYATPIGRGGNVNISSEYINLNDCEFDTHGEDDAGNIYLISTNRSKNSRIVGNKILKAYSSSRYGGNIYITNFSSVSFSRIWAYGGMGGGDVILDNIGNLSLPEAGIDATSTTSGDGGNVLVKNVDRFVSDAIATSVSWGGNGGDINITAGYIDITSTWQFRTYGSYAGDINIIASNKSSGSEFTTSDFFDTHGSSEGGNVYIANFSSVSLVDFVHTYGSDKGGNIILENIDNVNFSGRTYTYSNSGVAGDIKINAANISLNNAEFDFRGGTKNGRLTVNYSNKLSDIGDYVYYDGHLYLSIIKPAYGGIDWIPALDGSQFFNLSTNVRIANNSAYVNSNQAGLNQSANITLVGLPTNFSNPRILKNGNICGSSCYNLTSLNAGTVRFNVSSWSNYSIGEGPSLPKFISFSVPLGTTNFPALDDLNAVGNLTLANQKAKIQFNSTHVVNATGQGYDSAITLGEGFVSVNVSALDSSFNASAEITLRNAICPAPIYYGNGVYSYKKQVINEGNVCNDTTNPSCTNIVCNSTTNILTFTVSHFTGFAFGDNSNLAIWDSNDTGSVINSLENATFYANYTNLTGSVINGTNVTCQIKFKILSDWTQTQNMTFNSTSLLYEYTKAFSNYGTYTWNVSCNDTSGAYVGLQAADTIVINGTAPEIPGGAGSGNTGGGGGAGGNKGNVNATLPDVIVINLTVPMIDFGNMTPGEQKANLTGLRLQNDGTLRINVDVAATDLWTATHSFPGDNYLFKIAEAGEGGPEAGTFDSASLMDWTQMSNTAQLAIYNLNIVEAHDIAAIQVNLTVPLGEAAGLKVSTVTLTAYSV